MSLDDKYSRIEALIEKTRIYHAFDIYGCLYITLATAEDLLFKLKKVIGFSADTLDRLEHELYKDIKVYYDYIYSYMLYTDRVKWDDFETWLRRKISEITE